MTIICNCAVWRRRRSLCDPSALCRKLILSCNQTNRTAPKRENIQQKATKKKGKENQIVVECSSKNKIPCKPGSINWGMQLLLWQLHSHSDCCYPLLFVLLLQGIVETWQTLWGVLAVDIYTISRIYSKE